MGPHLQENQTYHTNLSFDSINLPISQVQERLTSLFKRWVMLREMIIMVAIELTVPGLRNYSADGEKLEGISTVTE